jgi:xanthine dehydrogenase accessory factor
MWRTSWIRRIESEIAAGRWCALATVLSVQSTETAGPGQKLLLLADGTILGDLGSPALAMRLVAVFTRERGVSRYYDVLLPISDESGEGEVRAYVEVHAPEPELVILGGGHVGKSVAHLASFVGLPFLVADDRPAFASEERFPDARLRYCGDLAEILPAMPTHEHSFIVICTRGHSYDEMAVRVMLRKPHAYVGLLGSRRKAIEIARSLEEQGFSKTELERVHTPIGLDIGAETPAEIAVSILAEILSLARSKDLYKVQRIVG